MRNPELVHPDGTVVARGGRDTNVRWWTRAGYRTSATLAATLTTIADPLQRPTDTCIRLREDVTPEEWRKVISEAADQLCLPAVGARALNGLKFSTALPIRLAEATPASRLTAQGSGRCDGCAHRTDQVHGPGTVTSASIIERVAVP